MPFRLTTDAIDIPYLCRAGDRGRDSSLRQYFPSASAYALFRIVAARLFGPACWQRGRGNLANRNETASGHDLRPSRCALVGQIVP